MNQTLNWALKFKKAGMSVIPLKPRSKEPLIKWQEFQTRVATDEELQTWFGSGLNNVGLVTGKISNLVVIDADGAQGISELSRLQIYSPVVVFTGGGGKHLYFKWTDGIKNSASKLAPKVDVRGEGGFIVCPPSLHESGKPYRFANLNFIASLMPSLPESVVTRVGSVTPAVSTPAVGSKSDKTSASAQSLIAEALEATKNGHVHNTLVSVLGKFRHRGFSIDDTHALLKPHVLENGRPFEGLREKIEEIWDRYEPSPKYSQAPASKSRSIESFLETEVQTEWLCKPFFSKPSLAFLVGLPECLKSWIAIDLAIEVARGGCWLGKYETKKSRVLFIDQERALPETQRRFKQLLSDKGLSRKTLSSSLFVDCSSHRKMDLDTSYESFRQELKEIRPDVVVVDSFVTFHTKPENDRMEIQKVLDRLKMLREEFGCTFVFINHENKAAYQDLVEHGEPSAGRMAGSVGVVAAAESILTVKKISPESCNVYQTKNSLANPAESFTVVIADTANGIKIEARK